MSALLTIEWIKIRRQWTSFILSIGMPVGFFLFFSSMQMSPDPTQQKLFITNYMVTLTAFSMSSFGFFTFPSMLTEDRTSHWLTFINYSRLPIWQYYLAKVLHILVNFSLSILVTFLVGACFRNVQMPPERWLGAAALLIILSVFFLAFGLLLSLIKSSQLMSVLGNIAFLSLAIIGGSWMPISTFPTWLQAISKWTPTYHLNQVVTTFVQKGQFLTDSFLIVLVYAIILTVAFFIIRKKTEVH